MSGRAGLAPSGPEVTASASAVVLVDAAGVIRYWDSRAQELFGYTLAEAEGRTLDLLVPDADRNWHGAAYRRAMRTGETRVDGGAVLERPVKCSDGTVRVFKARLVFMKDPRDQAVGAAMIFTREDDDPAATGAATGVHRRFGDLEQHRFVTLSTRRRNGVVVPTTVLFALADDVVYVKTDRRSGKVKRIRNDARVTVRPCTMRGKPCGEEIDAVASVLPTDAHAGPETLLAARHGWVWRMYTLLHRERMRRYAAMIEIRPAT